MNKPLFFHVSVHDYTPDNPKGYVNFCQMCSNEDKLHFLVYLKYYFKGSRRIGIYRLEACGHCYRDKIQHKSLEEMKCLIPLIKVKGMKFIDDGLFFTAPVGVETFYQKYIHKDGEHRKKIFPEANDALYETYATKEMTEAYINE